MVTSVSHATNADDAAAGQLQNGWLVSSRLRFLRLFGSAEACWHPMTWTLAFVRLEELKVGCVSRVSRSCPTGAIGRLSEFERPRTGVPWCACMAVTTLQRTWVCGAWLGRVGPRAGIVVDNAGRVSGVSLSASTLLLL